MLKSAQLPSNVLTSSLSLIISFPINPCSVSPPFLPSSSSSSPSLCLSSLPLHSPSSHLLSFTPSPPPSIPSFRAPLPLSFPAALCWNHNNNAAPHPPFPTGRQLTPISLPCTYIYIVYTAQVGLQHPSIMLLQALGGPGKWSTLSTMMDYSRNVRCKFRFHGWILLSPQHHQK